MNTSRSTRRSPKGFTLIEVLVVVAIIALLISILLPSLTAARRQAKMLVCQTNLRTICQANYLYGASNKDSMPSGPLVNSSGVPTAAEGGGQPWEFLYPYVLKVAGRVTTTDKLAINTPTYQCTDDVKFHTTSQRVVNGRQVYMNLSYAVNTSVEWERRRGTNGPTDGGAIYKVSKIKSPGSVVAFFDAGDDDNNGAGGWITNDCAELGQNQCGHEVHHKTGNNFAYVDTHVEFKQIVYRQTEPGMSPVIQWGLPIFPGAWVPNCNGVYVDGSGKKWTADMWSKDNQPAPHPYKP
jgi:prepilin-type N-terminal cleavage/methylation domain-containing protein